MSLISRDSQDVNNHANSNIQDNDNLFFDSNTHHDYYEQFDNHFNDNCNEVYDDPEVDFDHYNDSWGGSNEYFQKRINLNA
jgi:hypothetical protein